MDARTEFVNGGCGFVDCDFVVVRQMGEGEGVGEASDAAADDCDVEFGRAVSHGSWRLIVVDVVKFVGLKYGYGDVLARTNLNAATHLGEK